MEAVEEFPTEGINPALTEETVVAFSEAAVMQDNADSPQDSLPPLLFDSRPINIFKSQKVPKNEVQNVTLEEICYIPKELLEFSNLYRQKSEKYVWEWKLMV